MATKHPGFPSPIHLKFNVIPSVSEESVTPLNPMLFPVLINELSYPERMQSECSPDGLGVIHIKLIHSQMLPHKHF